MAHPLRIKYPASVYNLTFRGIQKKAVLNLDQERKAFIRILHRVNPRDNWISHAYRLMDNHDHLLMETSDCNLSLGIGTGRLFQGRCKAVLIQKKSHLSEECRYVTLNSVRARGAELPGY